jgi:multidrug efflux pump
MLTATILAIFWVPLFFVTVSSMGQRKIADQDDAIEPSKEAGQ